MDARWIAIAPLLLAFCNENSAKNQPSGAPSATAPASAATPESPEAQAKDMFRVRCAMCHGQNGNGDGPTAATLSTKPRDFASKEWQKSVTDSQVRAIIVGGGASVGKSPLMPPNPDLTNQPAVADELVKIVRAFGK